MKTPSPENAAVYIHIEPQKQRSFPYDHPKSTNVTKVPQIMINFKYIRIIKCHKNERQ